MKIGPLFKWFGSKWQSAKRYPEPRHGVIWEPFAGGCGYSLNFAHLDVRLWDSNPNVETLWLWLIGEATQAGILDIPCGVPEGTDIRSLGLSQGQELLMKHWQRTNNYGNCWTVSPWGNKPGQWTANTRARVAEQVSAIKHWSVMQPRWGVAEPATWFVDPPYQYNYRYGTNVDYESLALDVGRIDARSLVIVCEAAGKKGEQPDWLPFISSHRSVTSRRKQGQSHHSSEFLYLRPKPC